MNAKRFSNIGRLMIAVVALTLLLSMTGGKPVSAAVKQSSYIVQATSSTLAASLVEKHGGTVTSRLSIIRAVAANLSQPALAGLRLEKGIQAITPNSSVTRSRRCRSGLGQERPRRWCNRGCAGYRHGRRSDCPDQGCR